MSVMSSPSNRCMSSHVSKHMSSDMSRHMSNHMSGQTPTAPECTCLNACLNACLKHMCCGHADLPEPRSMLNHKSINESENIKKIFFPLLQFFSWFDVHSAAGGITSWAITT